MPARSRRARIEDVHELAMGMPHVTVGYGPHGNPVYQVGSKSFVFFRTNSLKPACDSLLVSSPADFFALTNA